MTFIIRKNYVHPGRCFARIGGPSLTDQSHKDLCDTTRIVSTYLKTGVLDFGISAAPLTGDASPADFHQAMNLIAHGQQQFDALPSHVRKHFHNDPAEFIGAMQEEGFADTLVSLGLAKARKAPVSAPEPDPVPTPSPEPE